MSEEAKPERRGRKPKEGGNADLARQLLELKKWTGLSDAEFADRINAESKATIGLLLNKIREAVPSMSASQASISYGILSDKRLSQSLAPQPTTLHQTNITVNGYSKDDLKALLSGKARRVQPTAPKCIDLPAHNPAPPAQTVS